MNIMNIIGGIIGDIVSAWREPEAAASCQEAVPRKEPVAPRVRQPAVKRRRTRLQRAKAVHARPKATFMQHGGSRKPAYQLIPRGATLLIDTANVLGAMDPRHAAHKLETIETSLVSRGFKVAFFIENRALAWMCNQQETQAEMDALETFCQKSNVTRVFGESEADLVILQTARAIPNSVCVTRDRFRDYVKVYPEIVGTKRHRMCTAVPLDDKVLLTIDGLRDSIMIEHAASQMVTAAEMLPPEEKVAAAFAKPSRKGLLGVGDACRAKGNVAKAVALYGRVAKKDPSVYFDMADLYSDDEGGEKNFRRAVKFTQLGLRNEKKIREHRLRRARLRAEAHRDDCLLTLAGLHRAA